MDTKDTWLKLVAGFTTNDKLANEWFGRIQQTYQNSSRSYHNMEHVESLLQYIQLHQHLIEDKESLQFAAFFHDYVYEAGSTNNERHSAQEALKALFELQVPTEKVAKVCRLIMATKHHNPVSEDKDTALFVDMDMAILGASPNEYIVYRNAVEKEFSSCPNFLFARGRRSFLLNTLAQPFIYHTKVFQEALELNARHNLLTELKTINHENFTHNYRSIAKLGRNMYRGLQLLGGQRM